MNSNKIKTGNDVLEFKLGELYDLENQVVKALGKLSKKVHEEELRVGFEKHRQETEEQIMRLEKAFELLDAKPRKVKHEGIRGIVSDGDELLSADSNEEIKDLLTVGAARQVEHYEMACYLTASELASQLGHAEIEELLRESLSEEEATDKHLSTMANKLSETLLEQEAMSAEAKAADI